MHSDRYTTKRSFNTQDEHSIRTVTGTPMWSPDICTIGTGTFGQTRDRPRKHPQDVDQTKDSDNIQKPFQQPDHESSALATAISEERRGKCRDSSMHSTSKDMNTETFLRKRKSPYHAWSAYEFTSRQISNVCSHCQVLLRSSGYRETDERQSLECRIFSDVNIITIAKTKSQSREFDVFFQEHIEDSTNQYFESEYVHINYKDILIDSGNLSNLEPVVLVAMANDRATLQELANTEALISMNSRICIALIHKEDDQTIARNGDTLIRLFDNAHNNCTRDTTFNMLFETIDNWLERYAFETIQMKVESLKFLFDQNTNEEQHQSADSCEIPTVDTYSKTNLSSIGLVKLLSDSEAESDENFIHNVSQQSAIIVNSNAIKDVFCRIVEIYKGSRVPMPEDLNDFEKMVQEHDDQVVKEVLTIPEVVACGEVYGTIHVYINQETNASEKQLVQTRIEKQLTTKDHQIHYAHKNIKQLVGIESAIGNPMGSIGGFVTRKNQKKDRDPKVDDESTDTKTVGTLRVMYDRTDNTASVADRMSSAHLDIEQGRADELCVLLSGHVARIQTKEQLSIDNDVTARLIRPLGEPLDIAVATINKSCESKCDTSLKDELNRRKPAKLFDSPIADSAHLTNLRIVYIWGATTKPGLGEVADWNFQFSGMAPHLLIKDRKDNKGVGFCKEGDSGALVCTTDRAGVIHAIGLVVGEILQSPSKEKQYIALYLNAGLDQLFKIHNDLFVFVTNENK